MECRMDIGRAYRPFTCAGQSLCAMSPFTLGCFTVAPDGTLLPPPGDAAAIRFAWRGRPCAAELAPGRLGLSIQAGRVPSTAERGADRARAFATLKALPGRLPQALRLTLAPDHSIRIERRVPIAHPPSAVCLVAAMVRFALELDPYLDALDAGWSGSPRI